MPYFPPTIAIIITKLRWSGGLESDSLICTEFFWCVSSIFKKVSPKPHFSSFPNNGLACAWNPSAGVFEDCHHQVRIFSCIGSCNRAPIGLQQGGVTIQAFFGQFLVFPIKYGGIFGALIIPKWLIKVPGHIAILFRCFFEHRNF